MDKLEITLWDTDSERISNISRKLYAALKECGLKGSVAIMSEPPFVSRMNMIDKIPALEINGLVWTKKFQEEFSDEDCLKLMNIIKNGNEQRYMEHNDK